MLYTTSHFSRGIGLRGRQRGVALFAVLVLVMLAMLLALWASRTSLFNEMLVGNDADYQRAFEAAQALMQDAELDIREEIANGSPCTGSNCRAASNARLPLEAKELGQLLTTLSQAGPPRCKDGLCLKRTGNQDFWNDSDAAAMLAAGVRYGSYTQAAAGSSAAPINPILREKGADKGGWYWIEVLPYLPDIDKRGLIADYAESSVAYLDINVIPKVIYRITAMAMGRKEHTQAILQQTYVRNRLKD